MSKLEQLKETIQSVHNESFKRVLEAQLKVGALSDMKSFVFGAVLFCPVEDADHNTLKELLTIVK